MGRIARALVWVGVILAASPAIAWLALRARLALSRTDPTRDSYYVVVHFDRFWAVAGFGLVLVALGLWLRGRRDEP